MNGEENLQLEGTQDPPTIDKLIDESGGCGRFQWFLASAVFISSLPVTWAGMMLAVVSHNPGWICLEHNVSNTNNTTTNTSHVITKFPESSFHSNNTPSRHSINTSLQESCEVFERCQRIEFNTDVMSTIVSEWGLVCSHEWVLSFMLSLQMVGRLIGAFVGGQMGNKIGRKYTIYIGLFVNGCLSLISAFSISWEMFFVLRILLGLNAGSANSMLFLLPCEFSPIHRRGNVGAVNIYAIATLVFAVIAAIVRHWKYLDIINSIFSFMMCAFAFWVPESMRFLAVKGKIDKARRVAHKMARTNGKPKPDTAIFHLICDENKRITKRNFEAHSVTFLDLFKKELLKRSLLVVLMWASIALCHQAIVYGARTLSGNVFLNLALLSLIASVCYPLIPLVINRIGRRWGLTIFNAIASASCLAVVLSQLLAPLNAQGICTSVFAYLAYFFLNCVWNTVLIFTIELFPTNIRSLGYGLGSGLGGLGSIAAPFLIPKSYETLYVSFIIYASVLVMNAVLPLFLPETKKRPLQDTFGQKLVALK